MTLLSLIDEARGAAESAASEVGAVPAGLTRESMLAVVGLVSVVERVQVLAAAHFAGLGAFRAEGATSTAAWLRSFAGLSGGAAKRVEDAARSQHVWRCVPLSSTAG